MGRRHERRGSRLGRVVVGVGVVGAGVLQAVPALAQQGPSPAPTTPPGSTSPPRASSAPATPASNGPSRPAPATPAPQPAAGPVSATPCAPTATACVSISQKKAWLTDGHGHITRGPVPVTTGGKGHETPVGTFRVLWKDEHHISGMKDHAPMPNSVFFAPGDAFHGGSLDNPSAGCVHLGPEDSKAFFDYLKPSDEVQILP